MKQGFRHEASERLGASRSLGQRRVSAFALLCLTAAFSLCLFAVPATQAATAKKPAFLPLEQSDQQADAIPALPPPAEPPGLEIPGLSPVVPPQGETNASGLVELGDMGADSTPGGATPETPPKQPPPSQPPRERDLLRRGIVRAEIRPGRPMLLSAPFPAILAAVLVHDGELVAQGQNVARFDAQAAEKAVEEARKVLAEAIERVQNAREVSLREREGAEEDLARSADKLREAEERVALSTLTAPFSGRVTEVRAWAGQHLKRGEVVLELAEEGDLEIICTVPSLWINRLAPGHIIWVYVEESAKSYEAEFVRFGGKVDPSTKSIRAYSRFVQPPEELLPGMSGRADFFPRRGS